MIQTIICKNCGDSHNVTTFILNWTFNSKHCNKCHSDLSECKTFHLCSKKCLKEFVNRLCPHNQHEWFETYPKMMSNNGRTIIKTMVECKVCEAKQWKPVKTKKVKKKKKRVKK